MIGSIYLNLLPDFFNGIGPLLPFAALRRDVGNVGMSGLIADVAPSRSLTLIPRVCLSVERALSGEADRLQRTCAEGAG